MNKTDTVEYDVVESDILAGAENKKSNAILHHLGRQQHVKTSPRKKLINFDCY